MALPPVVAAPGTKPISASMDWLDFGRSPIIRVEMLEEIVCVSVLIRAASPRTDTVCCMAPRSSLMSTRTVWELNTRMPVRACVMKPVLLTVIS